ncbi:MAG: autotransporter-associated beta strand repeat-containing protein [Luteolibacter sp.]
MKNTRAFLSFLRSSTLLHATTAAASIVICMVPSGLHAATAIWDGGGVGATDLGTAANWNPDVVPNAANGDIAQWNGSVAGPLSLVYSNTAIGGVSPNPGINFDLTIAQTDSLTIDSGTNTSALRLNGITIASGAGALTLGNSANTFAITLGGGAATHTWTNESNNGVVLNSDVAFGLGGGGAHVLAIGGAGNWTLNNNLAPTNGGTLAFTKNGAGTLTLAGTTPGASVAIPTLQVNAGIVDLAKDLPLSGGTIINGAGGTINATGGGKILLNVAAGDFGVANGGTLTVNSVIANGTFGSIDFWNVSSGTGVVVLNATNTFDGITNLQSGIISVGNIGNTGVAGNLGKNGTIHIGAGTSTSTLRYTGTGETNDRILDLIGTTGGAVIDQSGTGLLKFTSNVTATGAGAKTLSLVGSSAGTGELSGIIPNSTLVTSVLKDGPGKWTLSGASTFTGALTVAGGTLDFSGATGVNGTNGNFRVGTVANVKATLNILPGANLANRFNLFVGDAGTGAGGGAVYQSGGSLTLSQAAGVDNLRVGSSGTGYGYYSLSGTGAVTANRPAIGASLADTVGVVDLSGGTFTANEQLHIAAGSATTSGLLNVTGGSAVAGTDVMMLVGGNATSVAVVNVGGGAGLASVITGNAAAVGLTLAQTNNTAGALGVANLLPNGTLNTGRILGNQANATTHLNFNGGTLKATATNSGTAFMTDANLDAVNVFSGGGTIDNNNTAITISNGLLLPTGSGVSAVTISTGGTGYIGAPLVKITGGSGTGATGYSTISGGVVTGVTVTSRGIGYQNTDTLAVTFFGGGGTGAAATISGAQITANTSGGMTFAGGASGATTLSGVSTYTGATSVSTGKLFVNGSLAAGSAVSVASGATLGGTGTVNGVATIASGGIVEAGQALTGKLTTGGLTFSGAGSINFGPLSNYSASTGVSAGALTTSGGVGAVVINVPSLGSATAPNTYKLVNFSSYSGALNKFTLAPLPSRGVGSLQINGSEIDLQLTGLDFLKWTGLNSSAWNTTTSNWKLNSNNGATTYINSPGDSVVFDDSANSNTIVDISTVDVTPASVVFNNINQEYRIEGTKGIAGVTPLVKNNAGILTLTTANTYSGATTLNAGTLNIDNASAIGTGTFNINGGSIDSTVGSSLTTNNAQNWNADVLFGGTSSLSLGTGAVSLSASRAVITDGNGSLTVGGVIGGTGFGLTKNGNGTLILGGANTYSGGTILNTGTLQLNQTAANTGAITINGGILALNPPTFNFNYAPAINLTTDGFISKLGSFQINYTGVLAGNTHALNVSTSADSRFYLNSVTSGITQINVTAGAMGFDLNVGNRGNSAPVSVANGASLWFAGATNAMANNIALNGGAGQGATGALFQEGAATPTISGTVSLASGDSSIGGNNATGVVAVSGKITGTGALTKIGVNKYTFSGANDYTGSTTVNAGTLAAGAVSNPGVSGAFGKNSAVVMGNVAGAILDITGFNTQIGSITGGGTAGGNVTLGAAILTVGADNSNPAAYAGGISGTGSVLKVGTGTQILSGLSSFTGDLLINNGMVDANRANNVDAAVTSAVGNNQVVRTINLNGASTLQLTSGDTLGSAITTINSKIIIGPGSTVTNGGGVFNRLGSVTLNGGTLTSVSGAVAGYQTYSLDANAVITAGVGAASTISTNGAFPGIHLNTNNTFNVADATGDSATDLTVSAPLINRNNSEGGAAVAGGLTKAGVGTMTLSGVSTYTGPTTVNAGNFRVTGTLGATAVTVNTGATLSGSGNIGGTVHVNAGGHFARSIAATPGAQVPLAVTGNITIDTTSIIDLTAASAPASGIYVLATTTSGTITYTTPVTVNLTGVSGSVSVSGSNLILTVGGNNYDSWASSNGISGQPSADDTDKDGLSNLVEYGLGLNPTTSSQPPGSYNPSTRVLSFNKGADAISNGDVSWIIEESTTLGVWTPMVTQNAGDATPAISYTLPAGQPKEFARLKVVKVP